MILLIRYHYFFSFAVAQQLPAILAVVLQLPTVPTVVHKSPTFPAVVRQRPTSHRIMFPASGTFFSPSCESAGVFVAWNLNRG